MLQSATLALLLYNIRASAHNNKFWSTSRSEKHKIKNKFNHIESYSDTLPHKHTYSGIIQLDNFVTRAYKNKNFATIIIYRANMQLKSQKVSNVNCIRNSLVQNNNHALTALEIHRKR